MLTRSIVLLTTHFHLATLILADVLDAVDVVPETLKDPGLSRLHACQAVINALGTALNCDRHSSGEDTSYGSILLLDPAPELMAEVLLRTGNSVSLLYSRGEIVANSAQRMFSIINSALDVLTQVSNKASSVKSLFREVCISQNFKISDDQTRLETLKASTSDLAVLASCNVEMVRSFLQEMQIQSTLSPSHLEATVKQFEGRLIGKSRKAGAFGAGLTEETSLETFVGVF